MKGRGRNKGTKQVRNERTYGKMCLNSTNPLSEYGGVLCLSSSHQPLVGLISREPFQLSSSSLLSPHPLSAFWAPIQVPVNKINEPLYKILQRTWGTCLNVLNNLQDRTSTRFRQINEQFKYANRGDLQIAVSVSISNRIKPDRLR